MRAQCGDYLGGRSIACNLAEVTRGFGHTGGGPPKGHGAALARLDPARDLAHLADDPPCQAANRFASIVAAARSRKRAEVAPFCGETARRDESDESAAPGSGCS